MIIEEIMTTNIITLGDRTNDFRRLLAYDSA